MEVSAEGDLRGPRINRRDPNIVVERDPEREGRDELKPASLLVDGYHVDIDGRQEPAQSPAVGTDLLAWLRRTGGNDGACLGLPPAVV